MNAVLSVGIAGIPASLRERCAMKYHRLKGPSMPTTTVKCESWCVDHADEAGETCAIEPAFFGPEVDYGPRFGGVSQAGEVFAYRLEEEPTRIAVCADGGGSGGATLDVEALRHIHAAIRLDPDGFADALTHVLELVDA